MFPDVSLADRCAGDHNRAAAVPWREGSSQFSFVLDTAIRPVLLSVNRSDPSTATFVAAQRYGAGAWQALGPNNGKLPLSSAFGAACISTPAVAIGANDGPVVAYGYDNNIGVQRFDGTQWKGLDGRRCVARHRSLPFRWYGVVDQGRLPTCGHSDVVRSPRPRFFAVQW